ncbi:hypothetical protein LTR37_007947 [Vermiconidia calcicola]|uniref:Uncharacterized protein n=1 Tax=Vermiconidia calcicola TaxID=1690605 RepID=A0ACC3NC52_9PEZI|nr:hypothetical protein LTR37_007947 [Vermiconidia calcicola]
MYAKTIIAAGALLSMVAAVPLQQEKRDLVWTTKVEEEIVTVDVTTTIWLSPGETAPANSYEGAEPEHYGGKGHGHGPKHNHKSKSKKTSHIHTTVTVQGPSSAAPVPTSTYEAPAPSSEKPAPSSAAPAPSSAAPVASSYQAPPPSSAAPAASSYKAPAPSSAAPAVPSSYVVPEKAGGKGLTGMAAPGKMHTGDVTYYDVGLGACGKTHTSEDAVVAIADTLFDSYDISGNPNENPLCGKSVTIMGDNGPTVATVVDRCGGCANTDLDLSTSLFEEVVPHGNGRVSGVKWSFN